MNVLESLGLPPLPVPRPALDELVARGLLQVSTVSPLASLGAPTSSAREREAAFAALQRQGLTFSDAIRPSQTGALYQEALRILADPDALLRVRVQVSSGENTELGWFLAEDKAVLAPVDKEGVQLGPPVPLTRMSSLLFSLLQCEPVQEHEGARLWPTVVELVTHIWVVDGRADTKAEVRVGDAVARLQKVGMSRDEATEAIEGLVAGELVTQEKDALRLTETLAYWMGLAWSGHLVDVSYEPLVEGAADDDLGRRVTFIGPPGHRALVEQFDADALDLEEDERVDDQVTVVCHLDDVNLSALLNALLGISGS